MWYITRVSPETKADFTAAATELSQSTSRSFILVTGGLFLIYYFITAAAWPLESRTVDPIALAIVLTCALALWLVSKQLLAAQVVWQTGLAATTILAIFKFQQPEIAFFLALLPLMAVVTVGWPAGILAEGLVMTLVWQLVHVPAMPSLPPSYEVGIIIGGIFTGLLGWATTHTLLTVTEWSLHNFQQAQARMDEAREHRLKLEQVKEDLILANQELARLSDRLKAMHHIAEEARRAKEEFVANVSHELRTPLNMIISFSEMITQTPHIYGKRLPLALLADITAIQRNSRHLSRLVDDVLDLSQIETGRMTLSKETTSLERIIDAATETVRALFETKGLFMKMEIASDLPLLFCDRRRVQQVVVNLLSNAGRYTDEGGVWIKAWADKGQVVISVADTGPGISPEDQPRIFQPFQQLDSSLHRRHGGSGLGLNISQRFVEMHKGKMWLESELGVGTTFYVSLPADTPPALQPDKDTFRWVNPYEPYEERTRPFKAPVLKLIPRFVLLEPGQALQRLFKRYLDEVEISSVKNIDEAIREVNRSPAQAVVVNTSLLEQGPDIIDRLGSLPYGTPAVVCWVPGEEEVAEQLGVIRYLIKPITREKLLSTLAKVGKNVKRVLVVDDNPEVLQLFARILSAPEYDYHILQATDGQQALNILHERQPDVMLLDLIMPGMDGYQLLQKKKEDPLIRDIPVVTISARDPIEGPVVSNRLIVTQSGGLSVPNILTCVQRISEILAPSS